MLAELSAGSGETLVWLALAGLLLLATVAGFLAGVYCAPALQEHAIRRARHRLDRLCQLTSSALDRAGRACNLLAEHAVDPLPETEWSQLEASRKQLADAWQVLRDRQPDPAREAGSRCATGPTTFQMTWVRQPLDRETQIPDRGAFDQNLALVLAATKKNCSPSGLLLVRVDKFDALNRRYGVPQVTRWMAIMSAVLVKGARDEDLVCRLEPDLFGILLPSVSPLAGAQLAQTLRTTIREHTFHQDHDGTEVLVTASFGYAVCLPTDPATLVLDRAQEALEKSRKTGRNQLHVHDGTHRIVAHVGAGS